MNCGKQTWSVHHKNQTSRTQFFFFSIRICFVIFCFIYIFSIFRPGAIVKCDRNRIKSNAVLSSTANRMSVSLSDLVKKGLMLRPQNGLCSKPDRDKCYRMKWPKTKKKLKSMNLNQKKIIRKCARSIYKLRRFTCCLFSLRRSICYANKMRIYSMCCYYI